MLSVSREPDMIHERTVHLACSTRWPVVWLCVCLIVASQPFIARAQTPASDQSEPQATHEPADVQTLARSIVDQYTQQGDLPAAQHTARTLLEQVVATASERSGDAFRHAAYTVRLLDFIEAAEPDDPAALVTFFNQHHDLAETLVFLVEPQDKPVKVLEVLATLREKFGDDKVGEYANLTAALCVVHDREVKRHINENPVTTPGPIDLFKYYTRYERRMLFGVKRMPPELMVFVVDSTASIPEMQWALKRYAGHRAVGSLFFDIEYDYDHFYLAEPKKVTVEGFNLPNIQRYGGVCADQAYYAVAVGKAIGVPTGYTRGAAADVSHAWVGFFQQRGRSAAWNFDVGRYSSYQGVLGTLEHPQLGRWVPDSHVGLLAELLGTNPRQRHSVEAMVQGAWLLVQKQRDRGTLNTERTFTTNTPRDPQQVSDTLDLLEAALREMPGHAPGWLTMAELARDGQMNHDQKRAWASVLMKLCGQDYPDFALDVLEPMVASVDDPEQQYAMWESMFKMFLKRKDLAARIKIKQGQMFEQMGEPAKAGRCYMQVIEHFANAGPFIIDALKRTEKMLDQAGKGDRVPMLYNQAFSLIHPPSQMAPVFAQQSNYYRVGQMYAAKLDSSGRSQAAASLRDKIDRQIGMDRVAK